MIVLLCSIAITQNISAEKWPMMVGGPCTATPCSMMHIKGSVEEEKCQKDRDEACAKWHEEYDRSDAQKIGSGADLAMGSDGRN